MNILFVNTFDVSPFLGGTWEGLRELPIRCAGSLGRDVCVDVI